MRAVLYVDGMASYAFVYRCPRTGQQVQGHVTDVLIEDDGTYDVHCLWSHSSRQSQDGQAFRASQKVELLGDMASLAYWFQFNLIESGRDPPRLCD